MYEKFFDLQRRPFAASPDSTCFHHTQSVQTVFDEIVVCLERGSGIAVITAAPGVGKSLLCQRIKDELPTGYVAIVLRHANFNTPTALLQTLLSELKEKISGLTEQELRLQWENALTTIRSRNQSLVLVCDEAHRLDEVVLEELRTMTDLADHGVPWVRLLLVGQFELEEKLASPGLSALNQRIRSNASLSSLTTSEAIDYIDYRITWAGGRTEEVFTPEALLAIAEAADGVPRCLNQLSDHVLLLAYVAETKPAGVDLVTEALQDLKHLPLNWNIRSPRELTGEHTDLAELNDHAGSEIPQFGEHLATWESSLSSEEDPPESSASHSAVWEFGIDSDDFDDRNSVLDLELRPREPVQEPARESSPSSPASNESSSDVSLFEEPVIDRYAAIDGGWWQDPPAPAAAKPPTVVRQHQDSRVDDLPITPSVTPEVAEDQINEMTSDRFFSGASGCESADPSVPARAETSLEQRLQSEVLELVATTRRAIRADDAEATPFPAGLSASFESASFESESRPAGELPASEINASRPFRNLFTRLRRKQMGLE
ncbi:MAG: ATP-binding protein [Planctomycetaceae bacterium]